MNNRERIQKRIERDKARRAKRRAERMKELDDYDRCFDFENIWRAGVRCGIGVGWKASVQRYELFLLTKATALYELIADGTWQKTTGNFCCFTLVERGHKRYIRATTIGERNGQKCLCDNSLVPAVQATLIYDNGATMKGKGITFAEERLTKMLRRFIREHGAEEVLRNAYAVVYDFHGYFDSADHDVLMAMLRRQYTDERLLETIGKLISDFGERGLGLGSQVSQILALVLATDIDHHLKDRLGVKVYERYMDDGIAVLPTKEEAVRVLGAIQETASRLGLELNDKKTRIVKLSRGFSFLKVRYTITETGKIVRKICRDGTKRMRRRLKAYRNKLDSGEISIENVEMSMEAYFAHCDRADSHGTKLAFWKRFRRMFPESDAFLKPRRAPALLAEAVLFKARWEAENPGKPRGAMLHAWKEYRKERQEDRHDLLQVSFKRKNT